MDQAHPRSSSKTLNFVKRMLYQCNLSVEVIRVIPFEFNKNPDPSNFYEKFMVLRNFVLPNPGSSYPLSNEHIQYKII